MVILTCISKCSETITNKYNNILSPLEKDKQKVHTLFFHDSGYSLSKLPTLGRPITVEASVFNYFSRNDGELGTKKSINDESEKEIEDSENVLLLIENTVEDGNVIEEDHISDDE